MNRTMRHCRPAPLFRGFCKWPIAAAVSALVQGMASANPSGASVTAGQVAISNPDANTVRIDQSSASAIINWQEFSIGGTEFVQFNQPSASAAVLNRVVGGLPSEVLGNLSANGRVFLINPQGVLFGAGARVDVGSLVASTLDIADEDFLSGRLVFANGRGAAAEVLNRGQIRAADGGFVVLAGERVGNEGLIEARLGDVALLSGSALTLTLDPAGLVGFSVDRAALGAAAGVDNAGDIVANGGRVLMSAHVAQGLAGTAVNSRGRITAQSIGEHEGEVFLQAEGGSIRHAGIIDVSGTGGADGGLLRMEASEDIELLAGSRIHATGDGAGASGGTALLVAQRDLDFAWGAGIDARGERRGGEIELSGLRDLRLGGQLQLGAGGHLLLDPGEFVIADGAPTANSPTCGGDFCEQELENLLSGGTSISVVSPNGIILGDLADGALDGRSPSAPGSGGALLFGVGTDPNNFTRGTDGSITFADLNDSILLDGGFEAYAGSLFGVINVGHILSREFIYLDAADGVQTASLTHAAGGFNPFLTAFSQFGDVRTGSIDARNNVFLSGAAGVTVSGSILVNGSLATADPQLTDVIASRLDIVSGTGDILVDGTVTVNGDVTRFDGGDGFGVRGAYVSLDTGGGDITVTGLIRLDGSIGEVTGNIDWAAIAAQLGIRPQGGAIDLRGGLNVSGILGRAAGHANIAARGSEVVLGAAIDGSVPATSGITVDGPVDISGQVGHLDVNNNSEAIGGFFSVLTAGGLTRLNGPIRVDGSVGLVNAADAITARGGYAEVVVSGGDVRIGSTFAVTGLVDEVAVDSNLEANGAALFIEQRDGNIQLDGRVSAIGTLNTVLATSGAEARAADLFISAVGGGITADGDIYAEGHAGTIGVGTGSFSNGVFVSLVADDDVLLHGSVDAVGRLDEVATGSNVSADAAQLSVRGLNIRIDGDVTLTGTTGSVAGGDSVSVSGSSLELTALKGNIEVGGDLSATGFLTSAHTDGGLFARAALMLVQAGSVEFDDFGNPIVHQGSVTVGGDIRLDGTTGSVSGAVSAFAAGSFLNLSAQGDVSIVGGLGGIGSIESVSGGDASFAQAVSMIVKAEGGALTIGRDVSATGNNGDAGLGISSFSNGVNLELAGDTVILLGGIDVTGTLDATTAGDFLSAQAADVNVSAQSIAIDGDISINGMTGSIVTGESSNISGSLLNLVSAGDLLLGGNLTVAGGLQSVSGDTALPNPAVLNARATNVTLVADGGSLTINGDVLLNGTTGTVEVGSDSFVNGVFVGLFAVNGDILLHGNVTANGALDSTTAGDFLFAEAAEMQIVGQTVTVDGDVALSGDTGFVEGGYQTYAAGSFLKLSSLGGDITVGDLIADGSLGLLSSVSAGGESHAQAVALEANATGGFVTVNGDVVANGHTGTTELGFLSFTNGVFLDLGGNAVVLHGNLSATGALGANTSGFGLSAEAADVLVHGQFISIDGSVSLAGTTGAVATGDASNVSGSFLQMIANFDVSIGGDLSVNGSLASVGGTDPELPPEFLFARATSVSLSTEQSGAVTIGGNVTLSGTTGNVLAGNSSFSNGVFLSMTATDFDAAGAGNVVVHGKLTADGVLGSTTAGGVLFARATEVNITTNSGSIQLDGDVALTGSNGTVRTANNSFVNAISVAFDIVQGGDVMLGGDFTATGTLDSVAASSDLFARAAELDVQILGGRLSTVGDVRLTGTTGTVSATNDAYVNAVHVGLDARQGDLRIGGDFSAAGTLNSVTAESGLFARAAELDVFTVNSDFRVDGSLSIDGRTGDVQGFNSVFVNGAYANLLTIAGAVVIGGDIDVSGMLGSVDAEQFAFASGAEFRALPDGEFRVDGGLRVHGALTSFSALDFSGAYGADVFVFSGSSDLVGDAVAGGPVEVIGQLGSVTGGEGLFSYGAFASFASFQGDVRLNGAITLQGDIGTVTAGNDLDLSGVGFWADASAGDVAIKGPLSATGTVESVVASDRAFLNGAFAYLTATDGSLTVDGDLTLSGRLDSVQGGSEIAASGADLLLERFGAGSADGADLSVNGNISELGSIGSFEVTDAASSSRFSGGLLLNADEGSVFFRDISADSAFIYFNQDSTLEQSTVIAREYLEIVTPSATPTLSAQALSIASPEVFLSANMNAGTLSITGDQSLVISAARIHGDSVSLNSSGLVQLAGDDSDSSTIVTELSGDSVQISGARVLSDAGALIDAGALDVVASETIRLAGPVRVGSGLAQDPGDAALLQQLAATSPQLVPTAARPNAYFSAPTVALANLSLEGDYLHIQSNTVRLGTLQLNPVTVVHIDPLDNLPFFTESVDVTDAGLDSVKDRLNTENNRVIPNLGEFNDSDGDQALGARPVLNDERTDETGDPQFQVGSAGPNLSELVLQSGLADNTIVIGSSDYTAGIQISDLLRVDVLPSITNFVFMTSSSILLTEPIRTNGRVVVLGGGVETDRDVFYSLLVEQITSYYAALETKADEADDGEVEEKTSEEQCE